MVLNHGVVHGVTGINKVQRVTICDSQDGRVVAAGNVVKVQASVDSAIVDLSTKAKHAVQTASRHRMTHDTGCDLILGRRQPKRAFGRRTRIRNIPLHLNQPIGLNDKRIPIQIPPIMGLFPCQDRG